MRKHDWIDVVIAGLVLFAAFCAVVGFTGGCKPKPEEPSTRFKKADLSRWTMTKEYTPAGFPDMMLVHDTQDPTGTNDILIFNWGTAPVSPIHVYK